MKQVPNKLYHEVVRAFQVQRFSPGFLSLILLFQQILYPEVFFKYKFSSASWWRLGCAVVYFPDQVPLPRHSFACCVVLIYRQTELFLLFGLCRWAVHCGFGTLRLLCWKYVAPTFLSSRFTFFTSTMPRSFSWAVDSPQWFSGWCFQQHFIL